ncbi:hypothetical protein COOONC_04659 [Cooperia oncophora]
MAHNCCFQAIHGNDNLPSRRYLPNNQLHHVRRAYRKSSLCPEMVSGMLALFLVLVVSPIAFLCYLTVRHGIKRGNRTKRDYHMIKPISSCGKAPKMIRIHRHGCYTHTLNANNTVCSRSLNKTDCRETQESAITLSENRPQACFRLRNRNLRWGHGKLTPYKCFLVRAHPVACFSTETRRRHNPPESVKRMPSSTGLLPHHKPAHTTQQLASGGRNYENTSTFPGITRCTTSCGGLGCGCLLPTPGCLFSRTYAKPRNNKIYQVFHCPTWQESALMTFTYTGAQGNAGLRHVQDQHTDNACNAECQRDAGIRNNASNTFVGHVVHRDEVALIEKDDFIALRCPTMRTASNITECYVEDRCSCSPSETEAKCDCRSLDVITKMTSIDSRLPLSSSVLHLQDDHGLVFGAVHSAVIDVTISTSALYHADSTIAYSACTRKFLGNSSPKFFCAYGAVDTSLPRIENNFRQAILKG